MKIKRAKIIKVGNSFYFTVPKQFINNELVNIKKEYDLEVQDARRK